MHDKSLSKLLSYALRHHPEVLGLTLQPGGWVSVEELLAGLAKHGRAVDRAALEATVQSSDKQRFAFSPDGSRIRANQGHSVPVDLALEAQAPPQVLFHGTVQRFVPSIRSQGLLKGERHHVHLSSSVELALAVGGRRGKPLVLEIAAARMASSGYLFFCSVNDVWLTEHVPPDFIAWPAD